MWLVFVDDKSDFLSFNIATEAGLPDGLFSIPSFGTFWEAFEWNIFISFVTIWYTLWPLCFILW
jgi:hypothetical protein